VVFQAETAGSAYVAGVKAYNVGVAGTVQDQYPPATPPFTFNLGSGNLGWSLTPTLNYFPVPVPPVPRPGSWRRPVAIYRRRWPLTLTYRGPIPARPPVVGDLCRQ
jgi:hypothetical protein